MKQYLPVIAFLAPFVIFFAVPSLITYEVSDVNDQGELETSILPARYTGMIASRVVLMAIAIGAFWRSYLRSFSLRIDHWGLLTGIVGGVLWIGLCHLRIEAALINAIGLDESWLGARDGVNPFETYPEQGERMVFLFFRFALLVVTVPIAEELFLRGFFMRVMDAEDWSRLPLTEIGTTGLVAGTLYGVATHPSEFVAAAVWFSLVTVLMVKTGKFWNCVIAHSVTNLMLGIYVMSVGEWGLW